MTENSSTEKIGKLRGNLVETYHLLAVAEKELALTGDYEVRVSLRNRISEYERYLARWQTELDDLLGEGKSLSMERHGDASGDSSELNPEQEYGPAYFFGLARKAFSQGFFSEALALTGIVRELDPYYPGLETLEQKLHEKLPEQNEDEKEVSLLEKKQTFLDRPSFWIISAGAVVLVIAVAIITILLTSPKTTNSTGTVRKTLVPASATTQPVVFPAATDAPFLVPTPTAPVQPTVPPGFSDVENTPRAPASNPTPTARPTTKT